MSWRRFILVVAVGLVLSSCSQSANTEIPPTRQTTVTTIAPVVETQIQLDSPQAQVERFLLLSLPAWANPEQELDTIAFRKLATEEFVSQMADNLESLALVGEFYEDLDGVAPRFGGISYESILLDDKSEFELPDGTKAVVDVCFTDNAVKLDSEGRVINDEIVEVYASYEMVAEESAWKLFSVVNHPEGSASTC